MGIGGAFFNLGLDLQGFQNRMGGVFFSLVFFGFASLSVHDVFLSQRAIYQREVRCCYYRSFPYFFVTVRMQ